MIYLDSSVVLATLFAEDRRPIDAFWQQRLAASRLLVYEVWNRLNARQVPEAARADAHRILDALFLIQLTERALARALAPFPLNVKTLDGLHLASMESLRSDGHELKLATYDRRLAQAAEAMGFALWQWDES